MPCVLITDPWRIPLPTKVLLDAVSGGNLPTYWDTKTAASRGRDLHMALVRLNRLIRLKATPYIVRVANRIFTRQLNEICDKVLAAAGGHYKSPTDIEIANASRLWMTAIEQVMREGGVDIYLDMIPPVRSVIDQAYSRTSKLMGVEVAKPPSLDSIAKRTCQRITRINDTTRRKFQRLIGQAVDQGLTVTETADMLKDKMPKVNEARLRCIAQTELNNAYTQGAVRSFKDSGEVTHVSVIGCQTVEEDGPEWTYHGVQTCNIEDVPIEDADSLNFHPNHTGTMIPSRFRDDE